MPTSKADVLEQMGWTAEFYSITRAGTRQLQADAEHWQRASSIVALFLNMSEDKG